jgi:hypothetical protein
MQAVNQLKDVTWAEDSGVTEKSSPAESYTAATPGVSTRLVFPGPRMQVRTQIVCSGRRYNLKDMFVIDLAYIEDEGEVFASHQRLPVHGYGRDQGKALAAFCEAFDFQWRHLVEVLESTLTEGGQRRRRAMLEVVQSVEDVAP